MSIGTPLRLLALALLCAPMLVAQDVRHASDLDVPFEPTHPEVVDAMLRLAAVGPNDYVVDLGCGDGRVVIAAAKSYGAHGLGVDIDPRRVEEARANAEFEGVASRVRIEQGDIFTADIREASVVTLYLLDRINRELRPKLFGELEPGTRVVSHAFHMDDWDPDEIVRHPRARGNTLRLWRIPAHAGGVWRTELVGPNGTLPASLTLRQQYQILFGMADMPQASAPLEDGTLRGVRVHLRFALGPKASPATVECEGDVRGDEIAGVQHLTVGSAVSTKPWRARRDPVDLAGRWSVRVPARPEVKGTLAIERRDGVLRAAWEAADGDSRPLKEFYAWGSSVVFEVPTPNGTLTFNGLLVGDRGDGTANGVGWSVAYRFIAARGRAAAGSLPALPPLPKTSPTPFASPAAAAAAPRAAATPAVQRPRPPEPPPGSEYTNPKDGSVLIWIPGGELLMGSDDGEEDERPRTRLSVEGFWLGEREITYAQYARFLKEGPPRYEPFYWNDPRYARADLPVIGLTWNDARAYCRWAGLSLPSEAQWEYAAAAGRQLTYPTATGELSGELAACRDDAGRRPSALMPVGSYPANPFGVFDMAGNAWEFTDTLYRKYPYVATDGRESADSEDDLIVLRGGSFAFPSRGCRTAARQYFAKHLRYDFAGMRVAASAAEIAERRRAVSRAVPQKP